MKKINPAPLNINSTQYTMLMGGYKSGNFPKEIVNEAGAQISKMSIALHQYKDDAEDQEYINSLIAADVKNMRDLFESYAKMTKCPTAQLLCSLVVIKCEKILNNEKFDLSELLKS